MKNKCKIINSKYNGKKAKRVKKNQTQFGAHRSSQGANQKLKICQTTNASDFKLEYVKKFLKNFF